MIADDNVWTSAKGQPEISRAVSAISSELHICSCNPNALPWEMHTAGAFVSIRSATHHVSSKADYPSAVILSTPSFPTAAPG